MLNPHKDLVILRGWPHTRYANREYHFTRDDRDHLLHCRLKATNEMAMMARGVNFYQPHELPGQAPTRDLNRIMEIRRLHEYFNHASINEMKRLAPQWFIDAEITDRDIDEWNDLEGRFCTGCAEGKLKEHARRYRTSEELYSIATTGDPTPILSERENYYVRPTWRGMGEISSHRSLRISTSTRR